MALSPVQREALTRAIDTRRSGHRADFMSVGVPERTVKVLIRKGMAGFQPGQVVSSWRDAVVTDRGYEAVGRQPPAPDATARRTRGNG